MKNLSLLILLVTIILTSSCATILTGSKQSVTFKSNVNGKVYQNLTEIGNTNEPIKIYRRDMQKLYTIKSDGCPDKQFELPMKGNYVFMLNLLNGVFIGGYIDLLNGNNHKTDKIIENNIDCKTK